MRRCLRCRYVGEGVGYFRRPGYLVLLAGVSLFAYGFGSLVYWLVRRRYTVCPNCGFAGAGKSFRLSPRGQVSYLARVRPQPRWPRHGGLRFVIERFVECCGCHLRQAVA